MPSDIGYSFAPGAMDLPMEGQRRALPQSQAIRQLSLRLPSAPAARGAINPALLNSPGSAAAGANSWSGFNAIVQQLMQAMMPAEADFGAEMAGMGVPSAPPPRFTPGGHPPGLPPGVNDIPVVTRPPEREGPGTGTREEVPDFRVGGGRTPDLEAQPRSRVWPGYRVPLDRMVTG